MMDWSVTDKALARLADAMDKGTGCRFSAEEVRLFQFETLGEWAKDARRKIEDGPDAGPPTYVEIITE